MSTAQQILEPNQPFLSSTESNEIGSSLPSAVKFERASKQDAISIEELTKILDSTIKYDDANKVITFLGMLLTYTEEDQINIGFLAESSTGKSYIPLELCKYFPEEDVKRIGYASPTAFFHDYLTTNKKTKNKQSKHVVDLQKKILIFIDQPHDLLLQRLRPILSHDKKVIELLITDRSKNKNLRTNHIYIRGYPTVIFSSAKFNMSNQEKTRLLLLSPETTQMKLRDSIELKIRKESNLKAYNSALAKNLEIKKLKLRVLEIRKAKIKYLIVPDKLIEAISEKFFEKHEKLLPRNQRDISRLLSMIKANALLNFKCRRRDEDSISVDQNDVDVGFKLYKTFNEANELGLSPEIYRIYVMLQKYMIKHRNDYLYGFSITDYQIFYKEKFYRTPNYDVSRDTLKSLVGLNLLVEEQDLFDRRIKRYMLPECVQKIEKTSTQW